MIAADAQASRRNGADAYRSLVTQHHQLESRLRELSTKSHLSEAEDLEEHILKKQKLAVKDQIARMAPGPV